MFHASDNPRTLRIDHYLHGFQGSIGAGLSGLSGSQGDSRGLRAGFPSVLRSGFHDVGLFFNRPQGLVNEPTSYRANDHKKPVWDVCRGQQFTPWILGRFFGGLILIICAMLAIDYDNWFGRIGGFLLVLGMLLLFAPVPWDLGPCPADQTEGQQHSEYRHTFQHDVENVSQIPRLEQVDGESIFNMNSQNTLFMYYGRFFARLFKDGYEWPRDNILLAFFMVVVPPAAAWLHDPTHVPDWAVIKIAGWLYLTLFGIYGIYHVIRTPWKLSLEAPKMKDRPALSFGETVQSLAVEILDFIYARTKESPPAPGYTPISFGVDPMASMQEMGRTSAIQAACHKYEWDTLGIYKYKYSGRVEAVIETLPSTGYLPILAKTRHNTLH